MTFNELSAATTLGHQVHHNTLLNSKISKQIHDQGETSFCWAFAISSMLRQSLKRYFNARDQSNPDIRNAISKLNKNEFHKRLRNELIMISIPKAKFFARKVPAGINPNDYKRNIIQSQTHLLESAIERVSSNFKSFIGYESQSLTNGL